MTMLFSRLITVRQEIFNASHDNSTSIEDIINYNVGYRQIEHPRYSCINNTRPFSSTRSIVMEQCTAMTPGSLKVTIHDDIAIIRSMFNS